MHHLLKLSYHQPPKNIYPILTFSPYQSPNPTHDHLSIYIIYQPFSMLRLIFKKEDGYVEVKLYNIKNHREFYHILSVILYFTCFCTNSN